MKKGIVMIVTLILIMSLSMFVLKSASLTEKYLNDVGDSVFYAQFNRSFLDMTRAIEDLSKTIDNSEKFSLALKIPLIVNDKKSNLSTILRLYPQSGKFNINTLLDTNNTINQALYDMVFSLLSDYQINDSLFFMSLLLDSIDIDDEERVFGSEFTYDNGTILKDGKIENFKAFEQIVKYYSKQRDDSKIHKIPWNKIVRFQGEKIDYNYIHPNIKAILEQNYGINTPQDDELVKSHEDLNLDEEQKNIFKALKIEYFVPIFSCDFEFRFGKKSTNITFDYNLQTRRISNIETIF